MSSGCVQRGFGNRLHRGFTSLELLFTMIITVVLVGYLLIPTNHIEQLCDCSLAQFGVKVNDTCDPTNPLEISGSWSGCSSGVTITVWLTDDNGDKTYGVVSICGSNWTATFEELPAGDYTLTVKGECGSMTVTQTKDVELPPSEARQ